MFPEADSYDIVIEATGYVKAALQQIVFTKSTVNLALNKPTLTAADQKQSGNNAVDGNKNSRWESAFTDLQYLTVDLGAEYKISRVVLNWENAAGKSYTVQVSTDGSTWKTVYTTTSGKEGINDIRFASENARYVKMNGTARTTAYGYSLWEMEVYGNASDLNAAPVLSADTPKAVIGKSVGFSFDDDANWRKAITSVKLNGTVISPSAYSVTEGKMTLDSSLLTEAKTYTISVQATGFTEASVQQTIIAKESNQPSPTLNRAQRRNRAPHRNRALRRSRALRTNRARQRSRSQLT